jgi:hypothetical protein
MELVLCSFTPPYNRDGKGAGFTLRVSVRPANVGGLRPSLAAQTQFTKARMVTVMSKSLATGGQARENRY